MERRTRWLRRGDKHGRHRDSRRGQVDSALHFRDAPGPRRRRVVYYRELSVCVAVRERRESSSRVRAIPAQESGVHPMDGPGRTGASPREEGGHALVNEPRSWCRHVRVDPIAYPPQALLRLSRGRPLGHNAGRPLQDLLNLRTADCGRTLTVRMQVLTFSFFMEEAIASRFTRPCPSSSSCSPSRCPSYP